MTRQRQLIWCAGVIAAAIALCLLGSANLLLLVLPAASLLLALRSERYVGEGLIERLRGTRPARVVRAMRVRRTWVELPARAGMRLAGACVRRGPPRAANALS